MLIGLFLFFITKTAERRAQLVKSRSRQNLFQDDDNDGGGGVHNINFEKDQSPVSPVAAVAKTRVRKAPVDRERQLPPNMTSQLIDKIMTS